jgi:hypothetical protein
VLLLYPGSPRRSLSPTTPARVRVRADEAVINQWLLDQSTPVRRPAGTRRVRPAATQPLRTRQAAESAA